jgi:hypothetical protein
MGFGDFGSNGSVHWLIQYDDDARCSDHVDVDRLEHKLIGVKKKHKGKFRVTARYNTIDEAKAALKAAQDRFDRKPGVVLQLDVNVRPEQDDPGPIDTWEVRIDW